jgi:hypothetical protein
MQRRLVTAILAALALLALSVPALAGGWAVTTFDSLPDTFYAGQNYTLGYTIRQHGVTPISVDKTEIVALHSAKALSFPGKADGPVGHYVASVYFPADGAWTWQVTQGPFAPMDIGSISVLPALASSVSAATPAAPTSEPIRRRWRRTLRDAHGRATEASQRSTCLADEGIARSPVAEPDGRGGPLSQSPTALLLCCETRPELALSRGALAQIAAQARRDQVRELVAPTAR